MASSVQKIKLWDTFKNAKSVILHFFPVAEIGRNIHLLYFSYPQQIYSQFVEWGKKVLSPYSPQWSVYFPVLLLLITRKHPVYVKVLVAAFNKEKALGGLQLQASRMFVSSSNCDPVRSWPIYQTQPEQWDGDWRGHLQFMQYALRNPLLISDFSNFPLYYTWNQK